MFHRLGSWLLVATLLPTPLFASSAGSFVGFLQDESGQPLSDLVVALLQQSPAESLPILARTDNDGKVHLNDIETGTPPWVLGGYSHARHMSGDSLDAVLCAIQATGAAGRRGYGIPRNVIGCEGWIVGAGG